MRSLFPLLLAAVLALLPGCTILEQAPKQVQATRKTRRNPISRLRSKYLFAAFLNDIVVEVLVVLDRFKEIIEIAERLFFGA